MTALLRSALLALAVSTALAPTLSEAKRLGGGGSSGMQRSLPSRSTPAQTPPTPAQPNPAAPSPTQQAAPMAGAAATAGAAAQAGKRSWLGPIAGLAAGLGLAALMSHLGLGEAFAEFLMLALLVMAALVAWRWFMARRRPAAGAAGPAWAGAAAGAAGGAHAAPTMARTSGGHAVAWPASGDTGGGSPVTSAASSFAQPAAAAAPTLPADFDRAGFERIARMIFIRLQAANDRGDLDDLRRFTTPEMFAAIRLDLQDRGGRGQTTDVVEVRAEVIDFDREAARDVVSVRYSGLIREEDGRDAEPFHEAWHLAQDRGGDGAWRIAGIQQLDR